MSVINKGLQKSGAVKIPLHLKLWKWRPSFYSASRINRNRRDGRIISSYRVVCRWSSWRDNLCHSHIQVQCPSTCSSIRRCNLHRCIFRKLQILVFFCYAFDNSIEAVKTPTRYRACPVKKFEKLQVPLRIEILQAYLIENDILNDNYTCCGLERIFIFWTCEI